MLPKNEIAKRLDLCGAGSKKIRSILGRLEGFGRKADSGNHKFALFLSSLE
jgi:hypothetical protein